MFVALIPLRRGEKRSLWAYLLSLLHDGIPFLTLDALPAPRENIFVTLMPPSWSLGFGFIGGILAGTSIFRPEPIE